jgi:hypothetical protein
LQDVGCLCLLNKTLWQNRAFFHCIVRPLEHKTYESFNTFIQIKGDEMFWGKHRPTNFFSASISPKSLGDFFYKKLRPNGEVIAQLVPLTCRKCQHFHPKVFCSLDRA